MALHAAPTPGLIVIRGGRDWHADEAHIERIAGLDEAIEGATLAYALVSGLAADYSHENRPTDLRWSQALHAVARVGARASAAKAEILALTTPDGDAA